MLKAVLIDGNALARDLLSQILTNGGYEVVAATNSTTKALAIATHSQPQIICINSDQLNDDKEIMTQLLLAVPKALIFMVAAELNAAAVQTAHKRGIQGFILKPFNEATVLNTIRQAVLTLVKKQQAALQKKPA